MSTLVAFAAILIAFLVAGVIVQLLVLTYRYRNGDFGTKERTVDGDVVYRDDRFNELLYSGPRDDDRKHAEVEAGLDAEDSETITCSRCRTENLRTYTFCRNCTAELSEA